MNKEFLLAVSLLGMFSPININAKDFYFELKGGGAYPKKLTHDMDDFTAKDSNVLEAKLGWNFHKYFSTDISFQSSNKHILKDDDDDYINAVSRNVEFRHRAKLKYVNIFINAYLKPLKWKDFTPYIGGGVGFSRKTVNNFRVFSDLNPSAINDPADGNFYLFMVRSSGIKTTFAWNVALGMEYGINENISLTAEYKYMDLGKANYGEVSSVKIGTLGDVYEGKEKTRIRINAVLFGIRIKF